MDQEVFPAIFLCKSSQITGFRHFQVSPEMNCKTLPQHDTATTVVYWQSGVMQVRGNAWFLPDIILRIKKNQSLFHQTRATRSSEYESFKQLSWVLLQGGLLLKHSDHEGLQFWLRAECLTFEHHEGHWALGKLQCSRNVFFLCFLPCSNFVRLQAVLWTSCLVFS